MILRASLSGVLVKKDYIIRDGHFIMIDRYILTLTVLGHFVSKYWGGGGGGLGGPFGPIAAKFGTDLSNCAKRKTSVLFFSKTAHFISYNLCKLYA